MVRSPAVRLQIRKNDIRPLYNTLNRQSLAALLICNSDIIDIQDNKCGKVITRSDNRSTHFIRLSERTHDALIHPRIINSKLLVRVIVPFVNGIARVGVSINVGGNSSNTVFFRYSARSFFRFKVTLLKKPFYTQCVYHDKSLNLQSFRKTFAWKKAITNSSVALSRHSCVEEYSEVYQVWQYSAFQVHRRSYNMFELEVFYPYELINDYVYKPLFSQLDFAV